MTFSIVGYDPIAEEFGIAVQSKFIGVGAVVPWAKAGTGAIVTQAHANPAHGPDGLALMEQGKTARGVLDTLIKQDDGRAFRQVGIIDANGETASYTGELCYDWAGSNTGTHFSALGNILVGKETVEAMGETFKNTSGALANRLLAALEAGQKAGGDRRGQQSAAIYVVKEQGGYLGANDHYIDLRVDEHPDPINELQRVYQLHQLYFGVTKPEDVLALEGRNLENVLFHLKRLGYLNFADETIDDLEGALSRFIHQENFENRELQTGLIDPKVLNFLMKKASPSV